MSSSRPQPETELQATVGPGFEFKFRPGARVQVTSSIPKSEVRAPSTCHATVRFKFHWQARLGEGGPGARGGRVCQYAVRTALRA